MFNTVPRYFESIDVSDVLNSFHHEATAFYAVSKTFINPP